MKISNKKIEIIMARSCMSVSDIVKGGMKKPTYDRLRTSESARTETVGKLAKILGCDVTDILAD